MAPVLPTLHTQHFASADAQDAAHGPEDLHGDYEVMRIKRVHFEHPPVEAGTPSPRKRSAVIELIGHAASRKSTVTRASLSFVPAGEPVPEPFYDPLHARLDLHYPIREMNEVTRILRSGRSRFCYFWRTRDHHHMIASIIALP